MNTEKDTNNSDSLKHHEVDLNINNYETYLKYVAETSVISGAYHPKYSHTISGVLTYAYYEDVTVTFEISYESSGYQSTTYTWIFTVKLNAAGNAEFSADDEEILNAGVGLGPVDAAINALKSLDIFKDIDLIEYHVDAITGGTDAFIDVIIKLQKGNKVVSARGTEADIINASVKAYIAGVNRLLRD